MSNKKIAELISKGLRDGFVHPGRKGSEPTPIILPMFRTAGMPKEMTELVDETADLLGEAIVALIEKEGSSEIVGKEKVAELRVADENAPRRQVAVHCRCDRGRTNPLAILSVTNSSRVILDGKQLINGLAARSPECPHERKK